MKSSKISDVVCLERGRDNPILLNFQNAEMSYKNDSAIQCYRAEDINRAAAEDQSKPPGMALVFSDQQAYRGYPGEGLSSDLMNTFVAVRNKKTGKMRLIQVEECTMLNACYDDNKNKQLEDVSRTVVMRKFGGKAAIRALERSTRSGSNMDVMDDTIAGTVRTYDDEKFKDDSEFTKNKLEGDLLLASMRPPRNPAAKTPSELYLLEELVTKSILAHLKTVAVGLIKREPESIEMANVYLTNKAKAALQSKEPDSDENIRTLCICLVMDALGRLLEQKGRLLDKQRLSPFSTQLDAEIKKNFSQINHHQQLRTKYSEHKAITYYLAMAFMLENCVLNVDLIHAGLSISKKDLLRFAAFIGGSFNSINNMLTLRLTSGSGVSKPSFGGMRRSGKRK